ncbi:hypothetical protein ECAD30_21160 [Escherichia coli AD30]|nr:hypothetical protein ECAD30_21160 [Escherichia coli AD30]
MYDFYPGSPCVGGPDEKYIFVILIMNPLFNDIQMRLFYLNHSPYS